ncbi:hypothetical protein AVEN_191659-1 [Araneus ventricosus]|uniref:Uncharacterized protein n=1 Tax=Araneus ventricosus TaxID=182803 RepID=A0A4Y2JUK5_ARAVE|nr:hypothetical protein AVEN_191659-1 [Araneus ventricosus]
MHFIRTPISCFRRPPSRDYDDTCIRSIDCNTRDQTTLTRFLSGHFRSLTFSDNSKCFEICAKCAAEQATPDHILGCVGLSKQDLVSNPLLTLDFLWCTGSCT